MTAWTFITSEVDAKTLIEIFLNSLGFFIALLINRLVGMVKEQKAFQLMLASLRAEAVSNSSVISKGYDEFFPGGVVLREFRTATAQALLANPVFMKYSNQEHVEHINRYVNDSALANNYRRVLEDLTFKTPKRSPWLDTVDGFIEEHLKLVKSGIAVVSKLGL